MSRVNLSALLSIVLMLCLNPFCHGGDTNIKLGKVLKLGNSGPEFTKKRNLIFSVSKDNEGIKERIFYDVLCHYCKNKQELKDMPTNDRQISFFIKLIRGISICNKETIDLFKSMVETKEFPRTARAEAQKVLFENDKIYVDLNSDKEKAKWLLKHINNSLGLTNKVDDIKSSAAKKLLTKLDKDASEVVKEEIDKETDKNRKIVLQKVYNFIKKGFGKMTAEEIQAKLNDEFLDATFEKIVKGAEVSKDEIRDYWIEVVKLLKDDSKAKDKDKLIKYILACRKYELDKKRSDKTIKGYELLQFREIKKLLEAE